MRNVLITGIEGFTGRYLASEMAKAGYIVIGLSQKKPEHKIDGVQNIYECDLCNAVSVESLVSEIQPDFVVHLAAIAFVAHGQVEDIYKTNVIGTRNLLEALLKLKKSPESILLASSANVYGNSGGVLDELVTPAPANDYAISKLTMEYIASLYKAQLPIIIVRPFNYTGVGQSINFLIPKIVSHFKNKMPVIELGSLDVVRDFSDVRVVVKAYRKLIETNLNGETFNVCSGKGYSLMEVLALMREISGHSIEVCVNPNFVRANEVRSLIGSKVKLDSAVSGGQDIPLVETLTWMYNH